ncbi:MAG TPA: alpha/beta fold hydrolase [Bacteroidales bacterium]|nr:alpha/beta fold hydrolase [Bacteroidales bacterium]
MDLFYREYGNGAPVIMIHGLLGMSDNFIPLAKKLAEQYRVILPDLRNHGNSPHSEDFDLTVLTGDIIELYHKLNFNSAVIIGHSLGGRVAISAALKHPDLFSRLIVEDMAPRKYSGNKSINNLLQVMNQIDLKSKRSINEIDEALMQAIPDTRNRQLVLKNITRISEGVYVWKLNLDVITRKVESLMAPVFEEVAFTKPTLFIKGGRSNLIRPEDFKIIYKFFPAAEIEIIPNAGHWVHADDPQLFLEKVMTFLDV